MEPYSTLKMPTQRKLRRDNEADSDQEEDNGLVVHDDSDEEDDIPLATLLNR